MKHFTLRLFAVIAVALSGQVFSAPLATIAGQSHWRDSVRFGDADDSSSSIRARGNAIARDSAGSWVTMTTDSCSKWSRKERGEQNAVWRYDLQYNVRTSSGNTDSSRVLFRFDTRYCKDPVRSTQCDTLVRAGRHGSYPDVIVKDTLISMHTTAGATWVGTVQGFSMPHGNQIRVCVDSFEAGGAAGDTTYFRNLILGYQ